MIRFIFNVRCFKLLNIILLTQKWVIILVLLFQLSFIRAQNNEYLIKMAGNSADYKGFSSLIIYDSTSVYMEENGLSYVNMHKLTKILTYQGAKENSVVKFDYDPLSAYVEIKSVVIYRKNGKIELVDSRVMDYAAPARMIYWGARQKMVEIGHLEPGDAVEVKVFKKGFTYALLYSDDPDAQYIPPMRGHFYDIVPFWNNQPVKEKVYSVNVLKDKYLQYSVYNGTLQSSVIAIPQDNRMVYTFSKKEIIPQKYPGNTLAKSDIETKLLLSTSPDWYAKSQWFYGVNEDYGSFNTTPELTQKVKELLKPAKSELDSISILTHWVADNMRYSGISMGKGEGFTLHNAKMNFTDRCGVCKDKAGLLIAMLRAAGFESYAAMTMAGERIDRIPADQFNHSVTVVKRRNGEYQLLDPTWVPNVRELWSSAEQQQNYLMGLPQGADLMETPISNPENHYLKIYGKSKLSADGTLTGELTITAEGQTDKAVRNIFNARYDEWKTNVENELLRIAPNATIISVSYTNPEEFLKQPVKITYRYSIPHYAVVGNHNIIFIPLSAKNIFQRAMPHLFFNTSPSNRSFPFKDRCSRLVQVEEKIELPYFTNVISIPDEQNIKSQYINYQGNYSLTKKTLTFKQTISLGKRIYEADEWSDFRQAVIHQNNFANNYIVLSK